MPIITRAAWAAAAGAVALRPAGGRRVAHGATIPPRPSSPWIFSICLRWHRSGAGPETTDSPPPIRHYREAPRPAVKGRFRARNAVPRAAAQAQPAFYLEG